MSHFSLSAKPIDGAVETRRLEDAGAGACVMFEGWVRNHNEGRAVNQLDYQAFAPLALSEGENILAEARSRFALRATNPVRRTGRLAIGDMAVWVGVSSDHRGAAFDACRWIIDEIKWRVPIWNNEHYADGESGWLHPDHSPVDSVR